METIDGETKSSLTATIKLPLMEIKNSVVLDKAQESVVPTCEVCQDNRAFYQDEQGAAIYNKSAKEVFECIPDGTDYQQLMINW